MPVPAIAIHGSGPGPRIAKAVDGNFHDYAAYDRVVTLSLDWSSVAPDTGPAGAGGLYGYLKRHAGTIGAASRVGLEFDLQPLARWLGTLQLQLHRLLQWVLAALVALLFTTYVSELVLLPAAAWLGLPSVSLAPLRWLASAVSWLQIALVGGITLMIALAGLRMLLTMSTRPVAATVRSIVLLLLQPVLVAALALLTAQWWLLIAAFAVVAAVAYLTAGVGTAVLWAAVFLLVVLFRVRWARGPLRGPLKIALDALRYVGDARYRQRIQQALDKAIGQARSRVGNEQDFVLAGQGMGTVMALDSLLHSRSWRETDRVLLATMGSPIGRWFLTLYPATLFPESMESVVQSVVRRIKEFRWVNVHRPWDYMGGELGLKPFRGRDITTGIGVRRVIGHADYWLDPDARLTFQHGLVKLGPLKPLPVARTESIHQQPKPRSAGGSQVPARTRRLVAACVLLGTLGWMCWWVATGTGVLAPQRAQPSELLETRGVVVDAAVTHSSQAVQVGGGATYMGRWEFAFTDTSGVERRFTVERDASDAHLGIANQYFDTHSLTRQIRAECGSSTWLDDWWYPGDMQASCTLDGVRLRYYPRDPTLFDLPDYRGIGIRDQPPRHWAEAGVGALLLSVLLLIPVALGIRVFRMLLG